MRNYYLIPIYFAFVIAPLSVFASSVVINEVMFDPEGSDTGGEWIELYNGSNEQVDISGWEIYPDGIGYITVPNGFSIDAKKFMLIHLRTAGNNSSTDIYQATSSFNMSNTSGSVALFSGELRGKDTIKSFVQWGKGGETWEPSAADAGLWGRGVFVDIDSFSEGNSFALQQDGVIAGGKNAWRILHTPTPKAVNTGSSPSSSVLTSPSFSPVPASSTESSLPLSTLRASSIKTIKAYAGEDISSMVGVLLGFSGHAKGINDELIDSSARFFWNFGDGETKEGRNVDHIYRLPGTYLAGLHVSLGEYAASDYARVQIRPNLVTVTGVVLGADGFMRLANASDIDVDIGGWHIKDSKGHAFIVPLHTRMSRGGDIAIMNSISGLLQEPASLPLSVLYPNSIAAFTYAGTTSMSGIEKIIIPETKKSDIKQEVVHISKNIAHISSIKQEYANDQPLSPRARASSSPLAVNEKNNYAAAQSASSIVVPFALAAGVSVLGAIGFLVSRQFLR